MATAISERELAALLQDGLAGIATFRWAWKASESASLPPDKRLVTLQRSAFSTAEYGDMCDGDPLIGNTTVLVHVWEDEYEPARALNAQVRAIVRSGGWPLQVENDEYDGVFKAWRISGEYLGRGIPAE